MYAHIYIHIYIYMYIYMYTCALYFTHLSMYARRPRHARVRDVASHKSLFMEAGMPKPCDSLRSNHEPPTWNPYIPSVYHLRIRADTSPPPGRRQTQVRVQVRRFFVHIPYHVIAAIRYMDHKPT